MTTESERTEVYGAIEVASASQHLVSDRPWFGLIPMSATRSDSRHPDVRVETGIDVHQATYPESSGICPTKAAPHLTASL
jgi:hypothetical protein